MGICDVGSIGCADEWAVSSNFGSVNRIISGGIAISKGRRTHLGRADRSDWLRSDAYFVGEANTTPGL